MSDVIIKPGGAWQKDPQSKRFVLFDWGDRYLAVGVDILTSVWAITGPDASLTKDNETVLVGNRQTRARLIGGTAGSSYTVSKFPRLISRGSIEACSRLRML